MLFLNGEGETARVVLRGLVNGTVGFEELLTRQQSGRKGFEGGQPHDG